MLALQWWILIGSASALLLIVVGVWQFRASRQVRQELAVYPGLARLNRRSLALRYAGAALGVGALLAVALTGHREVATAIAPATIGGAIMAGVIAAELIGFRSACEPGVAGLERRTAAGYLNQRSVFALLCLTVVGVVALVIWGWQYSTTSFEQPVVVWSDPTDAPDGTVSFSITVVQNSYLAPYLGLQMLLPMLGCALLAGIALFVVMSRPRNGADAGLAAWDDSLRRRSVKAALLSLLGATSASLSLASLLLLHTRRLAEELSESLQRVTITIDESGVRVAQDITVTYGTPNVAQPGVTAILIVLAAAGLLITLVSLAMVLADFAPKRPLEDTEEKSEELASENTQSESSAEAATAEPAEAPEEATT